MFRPCVRIGNEGRWRKIKERALLDINDNKELYAMFPIVVDFDNTKHFLEIAFCFPYSYSQMTADIMKIERNLEEVGIRRAAVRDKGHGKIEDSEKSDRNVIFFWS
jgi:hypothetical protein